MQSATYLGKGIISSSHRSCSKIPHIAHHIALRQRRPGRHCIAAHSSPNNVRLQSTTSRIFFDLSTPLIKEVDAHRGNTVVAPSDQAIARYDSQRRSESHRTAADVVAYGPLVDATTIKELLQTENLDRLFFALLNGPDARHFIQKADDETFAAVFCALDPVYFIDPFKEISRFTKKVLVSDAYVYRRVRRFEDRMQFFSSGLDEVLRAREASGAILTRDVCHHLLKCARVMGNGPMATYIWETMMPTNRVQADMPCYNEFMGAIDWNHAFNPEEERYLLVTPWRLKIRGRGSTKLQFSGHQVSTPEKPESGIRNQVLNLFREASARGLQGDEATFTYLMVSMAREGDIDGVKSILKSVWNIDVDMLHCYDEEEIESVTFYEDYSPLRPTEQLLSCVVHCFCINSEVETATTLIDYISRNYNLSISREVWIQLYEWGYAHAVHRRHWQKAQGWTKGRLTLDFVENLFNLMTDMPHNIKPNIMMHILRQNLRRGKHSYSSLYDIDEADKLLVKARDDVWQAADELRLCLEETEVGVLLSDGDIPGRVFEIRRRYLLKALALERDIELIRHHLKPLLEHDSWTKQGTNLEWTASGLPNTIARWAAYLPQKFSYKTYSGKVDLDTEDYRDDFLFEDYNAPGKKTTRLAIIRQALDVYDYDELVANLLRLRSQLEAHEERATRYPETGPDGARISYRSMNYHPKHMQEEDMAWSPFA